MMRVFILGVGVLGVGRCVEVGCCTSEFKYGAELTVSTTAHRVQGVSIALFRWFSGQISVRLLSKYNDAGIR